MAKLKEQQKNTASSEAITENTAFATENVTLAIETSTPVAKNKRDSKSIVDMTLIAAILIVIIGCFGYCATPKLGKPLPQPQQYKKTTSETMEKSQQFTAVKKNHRGSPKKTNII